MPEEPNISVAKIAATPSENSWSQAYNAGKLFAVLSLTKTESENEEEENEKKDFLNVIGKDVIETLEQEFFGLEVKTLSTIKKSFEDAVEKIPKGVDSSVVVGCISKNLLYIVYTGAVRVNIKRGEEFGTLIDSEKSDKTGAISGILENNDLIVLQNEQFKDLVSLNVLVSSIDSQSTDQIAEAIAPIIHREEKGAAASVIIKYKIVQADPIAPSEEEPEIIEDKDKINPEKKSFLAPILSILKVIKIPSLSGVNHKRKIILTVVIVAAVLLVSTTMLALNKQKEAKTNALFESIYSQAEDKYKEGESLSALNKTLAADSFTEAKEILEENKDKFPKNSEQESQILALLEKVNKQIEDNSPEKIAQNQDRSKISLSVENGSGGEGVAGKTSDFLKDKGYNVTGTKNADNYKYEGVTIKVKSSNKAFLELLEKDLSEDYEVTETSSDLASDSASDGVVIVGK